MHVLNTLRYIGDRLQIALVVGSVPTDGSGDIHILYANAPAARLFGYGSGSEMGGQDVRSLMPPEISRVHRNHVGGYLAQSSQHGTVAIRANKERIMGSWRNLKGVQLDGSLVDLQANVADIRNPDGEGEDERYFVAIFRDRTEEVQREVELQEALEKACEAKAEAEKSAVEAESAREDAEKALQKQDDLSNQVSLLLTNMTSFRSRLRPDAEAPRGFAKRHWYGLTGLAIAVVSALVLVGMYSSAPITLVERVLLVFCGVLGTSLASVLMPRRSE